MNGEGIKVDQLYGMTTVDLKNLGCYKNEPFVLANDVAQVFYVKDMSSRPKKEKTSKRIPKKRKNKQTNTMSQSVT